MNGRELVRYLETQGSVVLRIKGSHARLGKNEKRTTVPLHGSRDLGVGLLKAMEKQTGVKLT